MPSCWIIPYLGYARLAQLMDTTPQQACGVFIPQPLSMTKPSDRPILPRIGAKAVIAKGAVIGQNRYQVGPGCFVGEDTVIGDNTRLWANVTIYHGVKHRSTIACFNPAPSSVLMASVMPRRAGTWVKIPQLGGVVIGNRVEIGANTCIDRGALEDTVIAVTV